MTPEEIQARQDILRFGHLCYERHLLVAMDGNLSVRLANGDILCTRAAVHKGFLRDDDLVVIDSKGNRKRGTGKPTSEILMHLACYQERDDVRAVIHAHPPLCVAFTIAGVSMARCVLPEVVLTMGVIPTAPYETTGTTALADRIRSYARDYDAILMDTHGAVCMAGTLLEAFCRLETMEHTALIMKTAHDLGQVRDLPCDEAIRLRRLGLGRYGGPPGATARIDEPAADLPLDCQDCTGCSSPKEAGIAPRQALRLVRLTDQPLLPNLAERRREQQPGARQPLAAERAEDFADAVAEEILRAMTRTSRVS